MQAPPPSEMYEPPLRRKSNLNWVWIVVGVIVICGCGGAGVLGAILVPAIKQAQLRATRRTCISNVKAIGLAQIMYAADFDDMLPASSRWIDATKKNARGEYEFTCSTVRQTGGEYGYAMSTAVGGKPTVMFPSAPDEIMLYETSTLKRNANGDPKKEAFVNRHGPGRTEAYLDAHVKWIKPPSSN